MNLTVLQTMIVTVKTTLFPAQAWIPTRTILAQALLESARFTSLSYTKGKNPFGLKVPTKRKFHGSGEYLGHAKYAHVAFAVVDYFQRNKAWPKSLEKGKQNGDYYSFLLDSKYAEDKNYIVKLKNIEAGLKVGSDALITVVLASVVFFCLKLSTINL